MAIQLRTADRNTMLDVITAAADGGTGAATLRIYNGTKPATVATALSGNTLLAQLTLSDPSAGAASNGTLTLSAITQDSTADATGTASFFRIYQSDGTTCVLQGDVGTSGSDLNLNTTAIVANGIVSVTSFTITAPGA